MAELREELGRAPRSSRTYTVAEAASAWLDDGLPGRSERTKTIYKDGLAPLLAKIGHRPLRDLTAPEGPGGAVWPALDQQPPDCPELAGAGAQVHERLGRNVAELIEAPMGRTGRPSKSLSLAQAQERRGQPLVRLHRPVLVLGGGQQVRAGRVRALRGRQARPPAGRVR